ncbi:hypothetical protein ACLMJK_002984 [Lecanora helva]
MSSASYNGPAPPAIPEVGASTFTTQTRVTDSAGRVSIRTTTDVNSQVTFGAGSGATVAIPVTQTSRASAATAAATAGSLALSSSAKVGIGVGVPFGALVLALFAFLIIRYQKRRKGAKIPSLNAEKDRASEETQNNSVEICDEFEEVKDDVHEIHGTNVPAHSMELPGSQGQARAELPA